MIAQQNIISRIFPLRILLCCLFSKSVRMLQKTVTGARLTISPNLLGYGLCCEIFPNFKRKGRNFVPVMRYCFSSASCQWFSTFLFTGGGGETTGTSAGTDTPPPPHHVSSMSCNLLIINLHNRLLTMGNAWLVQTYVLGSMYNVHKYYINTCSMNIKRNPVLCMHYSN